MREPDDIYSIFDNLDTNRDGKLDQQEIKKALRQLGLPPTEGYVNDIFRQYDTDGDGAVNESEFRHYVQRKEAAMRRAFRSLDRDQDGAITTEELQKALAGLGVPVSEQMAAQMVELIDLDHSSDISYEEFRRFALLLPSSQVNGASIVLDWMDCTSWADGVEYRLGAKIPPREPFQRLLAGGIAGAFSRTVTAPFERLRTMMMADARNTSLVDTARRMWASGGLRGLWRGNMISVVKVMPQSAIQYAVYDTLTKDIFTPSHKNGDMMVLSNAQRLAAGCISGASACVVVFPLETLRTQAAMGQRQMRGAGAYFGLAADIIRTRGFRGLYQGFPMGLCSSITGAGLGFATYEALTVAYRNHVGHSPSPGERGALAGGCAFITMSFGMPLEVVMRRMQVQGSPGYPVQYSSTLDCVRKLYVQEGIRAFWRGSLSSYMKVVPSIAAVRFCYETIIQVMGVGGVRRYRTQEQG
ncbi:Calcium-binding mitochondrial carrier protein SCaMC-1 [Coccomyxa sp. Obi]|nr:Calcium-binding mitochondrial carrier protein SCaMC-1 [Coccomyxa sp. Obi]